MHNSELPKQYMPGTIEGKWYAWWLEKEFFKSEPDNRRPFTIVIPPPNVTGVLHMGHMLNNTIQDVLARRARMQGFNTCWLPGTDHASIATEAKVVAKLKEEGIEKKDITRDAFLNHAWDWKEKHGGIILEQLKKLGASCDWDRTAFTMDNKLSDSVIAVFVDLYNKGLIYRGVRMVNWDPKALTALSDEEVIHKQVQSKLYYLKYRIEGSESEFITIATTRPETILGDTAICLHPEDERYQHLRGRKALVPLINRSIPIIFDEYVDREFGTGALKITPAHDLNDYQLGIKHNLPSIDIFNPNGTLNEKAEIYIGEDRFVVRKHIVEDLAQKGHLMKTEEFTNNVGFSERTDEVIEPKLSLQWFLKMENLAAPALEAVMTDRIKFHPSKFKNIYKHWMENVRDWCISRQLWWGHRIPAWYLPNGKVIVAHNRAEALKVALAQFDPNLHENDLRQDEDVLDTWFSSWLWPISVFDGILQPENRDIRYYYPTNDLVTAPEILFFWVARMIMAGLEYRGEVPFRNVYLTGIVRDKLGRKMSKSIGNSPDPIALMDTYGADGVRVGMLFSSPAGNDLLFDEALCEQGRNFTNKIWNAFRLTHSWTISNVPQPESAKAAISWFKAQLNHNISIINDHLDKFRIADALLNIYKLIWDDFCSWYLEMVKPAYQQPTDEATYRETMEFFSILLRLVHPYMPFISEELYQRIKLPSDAESIVIAAWPMAQPFDKDIISRFEFARAVVMAIRNLRQEKNILPKEPLKLFVKNNQHELPDTTFDSTISKLCNLKDISHVDQKPEGMYGLIVDATEFFLPLENQLDIPAEIAKLEAELEYQKGFLANVEKKLVNDRFVAGAPEQVVAMERKKLADSLSRIAVIEDQLKNLQKG